MIPTTLKATGSVVITDEVRAFIDEKLKKLERIVRQGDTMLRADIEIGTTGGARTGEEFRAEINLNYSGGFARAEATRDTLHSAIEEAIEEVRSEVHKKTTKKRDFVRRGATKVKDFFRYFGS